MATKAGSSARMVGKTPSCYFFVPKVDPKYFEKHPVLVEAAQDVCHLPTSALVTERILPFPHAIRTRLIDKYCLPKNQAKAHSDPANKDCLVRVYLGSSRGKSGQMFFSLRNFKMHLNQMVDLQLDVEELARRMAIAMAIMHWAARTDARDVEFVLGSSTAKLPLAMEVEDLKKLEPLTYTGPLSRRRRRPGPGGAQRADPGPGQGRGLRAPHRHAGQEALTPPHAAVPFFGMPVIRNSWRGGGSGGPSTQ